MAAPPSLSFGSARGPDEQGQREWDTVANRLLEEGLILTALELHTELLESKRELPILRDYFSNPGNFEHALPQSLAVLKTSLMRTPSVSTFDSLELGRYSDDGREGDEKVAVLEFELRKAYDTIKSLRGSLTKASDITSNKQGEQSTPASSLSEESIKPHEMRALNFLVHEYLNEVDNKLTAITFTEENGDQNFEDWDDVGLNIPKPPNLLQLVRHYNSFTLTGTEHLQQITQMEREVKSLNSQLVALKRENESLNLRLTKLSNVTSHSDDDISHIHRRHTMDDLGQRKAFTPEARRSTSYKPQNSSPPLSLASPTSRNYPQSSENSRKVEENETVSKQENGMEQIEEEAGTLKNSKQEEEESHDRRNESTSTLVEESVTRKKSQDCLPQDSQPHSPQTVHKRMSLSFRQALLSTAELKTDSRVGLEVAKLADPHLDAVKVFARCLPHVVPNVILAKREELIPLLLCVISKHSDHKTRDSLLNLMFNLIKRPNDTQRQMIMSGCVAFAKHKGSAQVESELLPQIWEQIDNKFHERRLLVAESCGVLAPHIASEMRGSLVLSMLRQMLEDDKAESVRNGVVKSLSILVAFIDDEDKFRPCWELLLKAMNDSSQMVVTSALCVFLPALAAWSFEMNQLESEIILYFLLQLHTCMKQVAKSGGESGATEQCQQYLVTLTHLVPWHFVSVLLSGPYSDKLDKKQLTEKEVQFPHPFSHLLDVSVIVGDDQRLRLLVSALEEEVEQEEVAVWKELAWFQQECLDRIKKAVEILEFNQSALLHSVVSLLSAYCFYFGHTFTHRIIKPFFESPLKLPKNRTDTLSSGKTALTSAVLPLYAAGVLATFPEDRKILGSFLRDTITDLANLYAPMESLTVTFTELKMNKKLHAMLTQLLEDLAADSAAQVRRYTAVLLGTMVAQVDEGLVAKQVVRTLLKLATDTEMAVRIETVGSLGTVMETLSKRESLSQVHRQFEQFVRDEAMRGDFLLYVTVLKTLAKIGPNADPVFRDEFIIPIMMEAAQSNNTAPNATQRQDIARVLIDAYRGISHCFVSSELMSLFLLPGLQYLLKDCEAVDHDNEAIVAAMLKECETKVSESQKQAVGASEETSSKFNLSKLNPFDRREFTLSPKMNFPFKKKS